jgi:hypothetical protein
MSWEAINLPRHMFMDNPSRELAKHLNKLEATSFILLSDVNENIDGVAWIPEDREEEE